MTKIVSVLNQKGGVGKTTVSVNLAAALVKRGLSVILADGDPQGSARDWAAAGENELFPVVGMDRKTLGQDLKALAPVDIILIDGAPQAQELAAAAIKASDLVIIPVQPSPYDLWASEDLVGLVSARQEITDGKLKAAMLISRAIVGTALGNEVRSVLEGFGLPVLESMTCQRVSYAETAASGSSVIGGSDKKAETEILAIADEILGMMEANDDR